MTITIAIFEILILLVSIILHELAHGYAALALGDPTAKYAGRLTLNPIKHLDLFGSIILPLLLALGGLPIIGWAKPVPYNPYNLNYPRRDEVLVAFAGPATNLGIAILFGLSLRFAGIYFSPSFGVIISLIIFINILLAIFNLVPIPPLDGSKLLFLAIPPKYAGVRQALERYGIFIAIFFIFFVWQYIFPIVPVIFKLITGVSF